VAGVASGKLGRPVHEFAHALELGAELAAGVEDPEIRRREAAPLEQRDGERIAESELHCRRGGGCEAHRTGLRLRRQHERDIGHARERALGPAGDGDERECEAARVGGDVGEFGRLAAVGEREHGIAGDDHAEVAMRGLGGVDEDRRRAGGGERGGDLAPDMPRLAHARDDDPAACPGQPRDGLLEARIERGGERAQRGLLDREDPPGGVQVGVCGVVHRAFLNPSAGRVNARAGSGQIPCQ
jgi:hypothetical protein